MDKIKKILKKISNFVTKNEYLNNYILNEYSRIGILSCDYYDDLIFQKEM